jgi:exopolysaccharide biosynthesis polyprenyl glycosylphosphotransferase
MVGNLARRWGVGLLVGDVALTCLALVVADWARRHLPIGDPVEIERFIREPIYLAACVLWPVTLRAFGAYDTRRTRSLADEVGAVVPGVAVASVALIGFFYVFEFRFISRILLAYFGVLNLILLVNLRLFARLTMTWLATSGHAVSRVLIVGGGVPAREVAALVVARPWSGLTVVGFASDDPDARNASGQIDGLPHLGLPTDAPEIVATRAIDEVIVALPPDRHQDTVQIALALLPLPVRVRIVPERFSMIAAHARVENLWGVPLIGIRDPAIVGTDRVIKRAFDLLIGGLGLALLGPAIGLIALAIVLDDPGPAFVGLLRVGENGRKFRMWKFRTMRVGSERERVLKSRDDPRVTRLGRFLRRWSLDEVPNLFNVLMGEMSLVGPRPEQPWIVAQYEPWQRKRLAAPPGMTGWWQVNGRSDRPLHENVEYDLYYIQNYSPWLDLAILIRTVPVVLRGRGAF